MLRGRLQHPLLWEALASLGHGSRVLIADGNFPLRTAAGPNARIVYLNLAPGTPTVDLVLSVLQTVTTFESVVLMAAPEPAPVHEVYRSMLAEGVEIDEVGRAAFYDLVGSPETGLVIATGDERVYANILLTLGVT